MFKNKKEKVGLYKDFDKKDKTTIDEQEGKERDEEQDEKEKEETTFSRTIYFIESKHF